MTDLWNLYVIILYVNVYYIGNYSRLLEYDERGKPDKCLVSD